MIGHLTSTAQAQQLPRYRITDLGTHGGISPGESEAFDINEQNQIVGWAEENSLGPLGQVIIVKRAFLWLPEDAQGFPVRFTPGMNTLSDAPDNQFHTTEAHAINDTVGSGVRITGNSNEGPLLAFVWGPNHDPALPLDKIAPFAGGSWSQGWGISNGDPFFVAGFCETGNFCPGQSQVHLAYFWHSGSQTKTIRAPSPGNAHSTAYDVREPHDPGPEPELVVGGGEVCIPNIFTCGPDNGDAMAWDALGPLALNQPATFGNINGIALGLHFASIVGWGTEPTGPNLPDCLPRALYWPDTHDPVVNLHADANPSIPAGEGSLAEDLNGALQIVGSNTSTEDAIMWEWDAANEEWDLSILEDLVNLTQCGWNSLKEARAINETGLIVGWGRRTVNNERRAFLLSPLSACPSDIDGDGEVSTTDLLALLASWGPCPDNAWLTGQLCLADINADCSVGTSDLLLLLGSWGPCGQSISIPQNVQDCLNRYCCDPENLLALEKCLCAIDPDCDPSP